MDYARVMSELLLPIESNWESVLAFLRGTVIPCAALKTMPLEKLPVSIGRLRTDTVYCLMTFELECCLIERDDDCAEFAAQLSRIAKVTRAKQCCFVTDCVSNVSAYRSLLLTFYRSLATRLPHTACRLFLAENGRSTEHNLNGAHFPTTVATFVCNERYSLLYRIVESMHKSYDVIITDSAVLLLGCICKYTECLRSQLNRSATTYILHIDLRLCNAVVIDTESFALSLLTMTRAFAPINNTIMLYLLVLLSHIFRLRPERFRRLNTCTRYATGTAVSSGAKYLHVFPQALSPILFARELTDKLGWLRRLRYLSYYLYNCHRNCILENPCDVNHGFLLLPNSHLGLAKDDR